MTINKLGSFITNKLFVVTSSAFKPTEFANQDNNSHNKAPNIIKYFID